MVKSEVRILVVDDDSTLRMLNTLTLNSMGFTNINVAVDGADALDLLKMSKFDLIISDVNMPRLDGFGLLKTMGIFGYLSETPVIMVTSEAQAEDRKRAASLGASAYLLKPVNKAELQNTITRILGT